MTINNVKGQTKLVIIKGSGNIRELGNICAPILTPQYVDVSTVAKIVSSGRTVLEVNPDNRNETIKLTLSNVRTANFKTAEPAAPAPVKTQAAPAPAAAKVETSTGATKKDEKKDTAKTVTPAVKSSEASKTTSMPASDFAAK